MSFKLMEEEIKLEANIQIVVVTDREVSSFIKKYHVYRNLWTPILYKELYAYKYAVVVKRGELLVERLLQYECGKFVKIVFYIL